MATNTTYVGRFEGMFDSQVADVLENAMEMLDYGDEIFFAEIGLERHSMESAPVVEGLGSAEEPIDLTEEEDDDVTLPYWTNVDEVEMGGLLNQN
jgi:hypothetical protein